MGRFRDEDGQSFVEFAFIMPFLVFLLLGIVQFGSPWHNYISITDAARVGARAAAVNRAAGPCAAATTRIRTTSWGHCPAGSSIRSCTAGTGVGEDITITITYAFDVGLPDFEARRWPDVHVQSAKERLE